MEELGHSNVFCINLQEIIFFSLCNSPWICCSRNGMVSQYNKRNARVAFSQLGLVERFWMIEASPVWIVVYKCKNIFKNFRTLYINVHYPFKIGGRTLNVSYSSDVFSRRGTLKNVSIHLAFKTCSNCNLHFEQVPPSFSKKPRA